MIGCRQQTFQNLVALCARVRNGCVWPGCGDERITPADTGMVWAYAINGSVFDDGSREGACHPAAVVIPTVVALAEDRSWERVDSAVVAGYDVMVRLARGGNPLFSRNGFHPTAITAPFGAAATASVLLGHDIATAQNALCIAALGSSGLMAAFRSGGTQPLQVSWGVRNGIMASMMAAVGNRGYSRILEQGFYPTYLGQHQLIPVDQPLRHEYAMAGSYLKAYPGCRHLHPSIDAFDDILKANRIMHDEIDAVRVGTYKLALETEIHDVKSREDAYFSIPYALAARAVMGNNGYDAFDEKHFCNPVLQAFMNKVEVRTDSELDNCYPRQRGAVVEIDTIQGTTLARKVEYPLGEPENPLPQSATLAKFRDAACASLSEESIRKIETLLDVSDPSDTPEGLFAAVCESWRPSRKMK